MNNKSGVKLKLDKERLLRYDLNALIELEDKYGSVTKAFEILENIGKKSKKEGANGLKEIRYLLFLGLKHEDEELTENQVGKLFDFVTMTEMVSLIPEALFIALPEEKEEKGKN